MKRRLLIPVLLTLLLSCSAIQSGVGQRVALLDSLYQHGAYGQMIDSLEQESSSAPLRNYYLGLANLSLSRVAEAEHLLMSYKPRERERLPVALLAVKIALAQYDFPKASHLLAAIPRPEPKDSLTLQAVAQLHKETDLLSRLYEKCPKVTILKAYQGATPQLLAYINERLLNGVGHLSSSAFELYCRPLRVLSVPNSVGGRSVAFAYQLGNGEWESPRVIPINGLDPSGVIAYPYLMPDGVTLYFAYKSAHTLNGRYDLYVSRYSSEKGAFLVPQLLGMPFNSLADDYLYLPSEDPHQVWLLSNRACAPDSLHLYHLRLPLSSKSATDSTVMTVERALLKDTLISALPALPIPKRKDELLSKRVPLVVVAGHPIYTISEVSDGTAAQILQQYLQYRKALLKESALLAHLRQKLIDDPSRSGDVSLVSQIKGLESSVAQGRKQMQALLASFVATYKP